MSLKYHQWDYLPQMLKISLVFKTVILSIPVMFLVELPCIANNNLW